ncbi:MAG: HAD family phosphatase [Anaerolineales bacterium]
MEKTIVFDLGGVLLDWNPRYLYRQLFPDHEELDYFLEEICSPAWNAQMDASKPFQEAIDELIPQYPAYSEQIQAYFSRWKEMMGGAFPEVVDILRELKSQGWPLAALSNWSTETFPSVKDDYEFLEWFDPLILSGELGVAKPDPAIYHHLLQELQVKPQNCLFIDDSWENIREAEGQGFDTIHFKTPALLREELMVRGIL